jgi:hypothetical protein
MPSQGEAAMSFWPAMIGWLVLGLLRRRNSPTERPYFLRTFTDFSLGPKWVKGKTGARLCYAVIEFPTDLKVQALPSIAPPFPHEMIIKPHHTEGVIITSAPAV